jgi:hypothetical protein
LPYPPFERPDSIFYETHTSRNGVPITYRKCGCEIRSGRKPDVVGPLDIRQDRGPDISVQSFVNVQREHVVVDEYQTGVCSRLYVFPPPLENEADTGSKESSDDDAQEPEDSS